MPIDAGGRASYRERFIHSEIYRARPDVMSVVHCHTPSLLPFADSDVPMRAMYHMAAFVALGVPVFDIRKEAGITDLLVGDTRLGRALARTLADKYAVLMRHHGAVVVANSIPNAVARAVYLDQNARIQLQTAAIGGHATYVDPGEAKLRMADPNEYTRAWDLWKLEVRAVTRRSRVRPAGGTHRVDDERERRPTGRTQVDRLFVDRWSPRAMSGEPISNEELLRLFEAARWAPSAGNLQPWRFLYARRDTPEWPLFFDLLNPGNKTWCVNAAVLVLFISQTVNVESGGRSRPTPMTPARRGRTRAAGSDQRPDRARHAGVQLRTRPRRAADSPRNSRVEAMAAIGRPGRNGRSVREPAGARDPQRRRALSETAIEGIYRA